MCRWLHPLVLLLLSGCAAEGGKELRESHDLIEQTAWAHRSAEGDSIRADPDRGLLWMANGERIDFFVKVSAGSSVAFDRLRSRGGNDEADFVITFERRGDERRHLIRRLKAAKAPQSFPLPDGTDEICRLSFISDSPDDASGGFVIWRPRIVTESAAEHTPPAFDLATNAGESRGKPNIVLYLVDTLRKDRLGVYGYDQPVSPRVDDFALGATVYDNAVAQSPWTRPSVASIFTGLDPRTHGVNRREDSLGAEARTLAELLSETGYQTAAFFTNGNVSASFGFDQGFDITWKSRFLRYHANYLNEEVTSYLKSEVRREPFFLYIHAADPHAPYEPFEPFFSCFAGGVEHPELGDLDLLGAITRRLGVGHPFVDDVLALYDAEIAFNDEYFGQLIEILKVFDLYDNTLIVFVSDHGEEFWERGEWSHGQSLYGELIDIPLIVKAPYQETPQRNSQLAQHIDLFATALDYAGVAYGQYTRGLSLRRLANGESWRSAYSKMDVDGRQGVSVTDGTWKLIVPRNQRAGPRPMLFNRRLDEREQDDLCESEPLVVAYMMTLLRRHESAGQTTLKPATGVMTEEIVEELKALGYIQ